MYCKNCGNLMDPNAVVCVRCGCTKGTGISYCPNCGQPTTPGAFTCVSCGASLNVASSAEPKSKLVAGLLALFLGGLGIHNFYLGFTQKAVTQLLVNLIGGALTCGIASIAIGIWVLVEAIYIFTGKINVDANGIPLKD